MKNSRFTIAIHILCLLAMKEKKSPGGLANSQRIAESVNTSPVIIRRILGKLRQAKLVEIQGGATGGARLSKDADKITLTEVFQAIDEIEIFLLHPNKPSNKCPVGAKITPILTEVYETVNMTVENSLNEITIGNLINKLQKNTTIQENTKDKMDA